MRTGAVDPFQKVRFLQCQVEEGVVKVPQQDVPKGLTLVFQKPIPQGQGSPIPGNPQQEKSTDGHAILEMSFFTPGPTYHLKELNVERKVHFVD